MGHEGTNGACIDPYKTCMGPIWACRGQYVDCRDQYWISTAESDLEKFWWRGAVKVGGGATALN